MPRAVKVKEMHDWSELRTNLTLKPNKVTPFFNALDSADGISREFVENSIVDSGYGLVFEDPVGDWSGHERFASILAPYVGEGYLRSIGEGSRRWGYYFDGQGSVFPIRFYEKIDYQQPVESMRERRAEKRPGYFEIGLGQRESEGFSSPTLRFRLSWPSSRSGNQ